MAIIIMIFFLLGAGILFLVQTCQALRLGVIADIHLDPSYNGTCGVLCYDLGDYG